MCSEVEAFIEEFECENNWKTKKSKNFNFFCANLTLILIFMILGIELVNLVLISTL